MQNRSSSSNCRLSLVQVWGPSSALPFHPLNLPHPPVGALSQTNTSQWVHAFHRHVPPAPSPLMVFRCTSLPLPGSLGSPPFALPHLPPLLLISAPSPPSMWVLLMATSMRNQCLWHKHGTPHVVGERRGRRAGSCARLTTSDSFANDCIITSAYARKWPCKLINTLAFS